MHPDAEADPYRNPPVLPGRCQHGCTGAEQPELHADDKLYRRLATGSAITRNRPADRLVTTIPATVSSAARPVPTASGAASHDGAAA